MLRTARACRTLLDRDGFSPLGAVIVVHWLWFEGPGFQLFLLFDYPQHRATYVLNLWLLAVLGSVFIGWKILRSRGVVSAASGLGIIFAALGLTVRFVGEWCLWPVLLTVDEWSLAPTLPSQPSAGWRELQDFILVYRYGGAAAFAVGMLLTASSGVRDALTWRAGRRNWGAW